MKGTFIVAITIALALITTSLFANVTVKNMDSMPYSLELNCNELVTPMYVEEHSSFVFHMQGNACELTLIKTHDRVSVHDGDFLVIRNMNLFKN